ncbi:sensor histidine kinase [Robertmurraya sp. P23]|uniref:sensor histidine kinase n=1 Tax=Robertmurraya sp. P23 TaxID=3436931 RepID=UPI003D96A8CA
MKALIKKVKNEKYRYRNFILILALSIGPLMGLGFVSFNITKNLLIENQTSTIQNHLETSSEVADLLFRNIINMERIITWNKDVQKELKESVTLDVAGGRLVDNGSLRRLQDHIASSFIDTQDIESVCIFNVEFQGMCYGKSESYGRYGNGGFHEYIQDTDWYKEVVKKDGKAIFYGYNVLQGNKSANTFSSVKLLKDPGEFYDPATTGILVVNINKSIFSRVFKKSEDSAFLIFDHDQGIMRDVYRYSSSFQISEQSESPLEDLKKEGYIVTDYKNRITGWTFSHVINEKELLKQSNQIRNVTISIASVIAIVAFVFSFLLSETLSNPIMRLRKMAAEWTSGLLQASESDTPTDEIGAIGQTFQKITGENKALNEELIRAQLKEREAELRALQAQIKPHFLYNTLDSMYWMASLENNHEVAKMAVALSETFKLSLNNGKDMIPVSKELEHIKHYLTIQNLRFNHRFMYVEEVDPLLLDKEILKLLLQPLVENSIYHGLEPKVGKGTITLTGRLEDGWVLFTVEDDGVGIEDLDVTRTGYGMQNVRERLFLCYGEESELTVTSKVNEGTKVEIRFREHKGGQELAEGSHF